MRVSRTFSTPAYWPRTDSRSVQYRDASLDVVYTVQSQQAPSSRPPDSKLNLLFVHGAQFTKEGWNYWVDLCFQEWGDQIDKCITMDHVHHGDSAVVNEGRVGFFIPWDDMGRDAGLVIRDCIRRGEISKEAPLIVVAHSMGGAASLCLSVFDPGLVTALVLADPVWMGADAKLAEVDIYARTFARLSLAVHRRARDEFDSLDDYYKFMDKHYLTAKLHPQTKKYQIDSLWRIEDGKVKLKMNRALQAAAYYAGISMIGVGQSIIHRVKVPVLVFHGDVHDFNPPGSNESLAEILLKAERVMIPGSGHLVPYTQPDECFNAVKGFITREFHAELEHRANVDKQWGPTNQERYLKQVVPQSDGGHPAGLSKL